MQYTLKCKRTKNVLNSMQTEETVDFKTKNINKVSGKVYCVY